MVGREAAVESIVVNNMRKRRAPSLQDSDRDHKRPRTHDSVLEV